MKIEQQVCTLEQAKRLKELGVKQHSFFAWVELEKPELISRHTNRKELDVYNTLSFENISAFTVAELGVMIDWNLCSTGMAYEGDKKYYVFTNDDDFSNENEAVVRADALIFLLENNLTTASSVNTRL